MARQLKWSDMSGAQRVATVVTGVVQMVLTAIALRDLSSRSPEAVRGPKWVWRLLCLVQPVGPVAYLTVGRVTAEERD